MDVAKAVAAGRTQEGVPTGLLPGNQPSVAILVEAAEHGKALVRLLPQWALRTIHTAAGAIPQLDHLEIATMRSAAVYGVSVDVLIRADGGPGWPLGDAICSRVVGSSSRVLVLDFADRRDEQAVRDTQSRHTAYRELGWYVSSAPQTWTRREH